VAAAITASTTTPAASRCQKLLSTGGPGGAGGGAGAQEGTGEPDDSELAGGRSDWSAGGPSGSSLEDFSTSDIGVYLR